MDAVLNPQVIKTLVRMVDDGISKSDIFGFKIEFDGNTAVIGDINNDPYVVLNIRNTSDDGYNGFTKVVSLGDYDTTKEKIYYLQSVVARYTDAMYWDAIPKCKFNLYYLIGDGVNDTTFIQEVSSGFTKALLRNLIVPSGDTVSITSYYESRANDTEECIEVFSAVARTCDVFLFDSKIIVSGGSNIGTTQFSKLGPIGGAMCDIFARCPIVPSSVTIERDYSEEDYVLTSKNLSHATDLMIYSTFTNPQFLSSSGKLLTTTEAVNIVNAIGRAWGLHERLEMPPKPTTPEQLEALKNEEVKCDDIDAAIHPAELSPSVSNLVNDETN